MSRVDELGLRLASLKRHKFTTRQEVEAAIDAYAKMAEKNEEKRDIHVFESSEYWRYHDLAMKWHEQARLLMPKGS